MLRRCAYWNKYGCTHVKEGEDGDFPVVPGAQERVAHQRKLRRARVALVRGVAEHHRVLERRIGDGMGVEVALVEPAVLRARYQDGRILAIPRQRSDCVQQTKQR